MKLEDKPTISTRGLGSDRGPARNGPSCSSPAPGPISLLLAAVLGPLPGGPAAGATRPNVVFILADDLGYSDLGCYGGEIETPNLDRLARQGLRFSQFYNTARCSPSRASMMTGLHPHQTGIGILTYDTGPEGYAGNLNKSCVSIAEALKSKNYKSYLSGKWHIAKSLTEPTDAWPLQRGFDEFWGTIIGAGSFYHPNTLTRGNDNIEHEAEESPAF